MINQPVQRLLKKLKDIEIKEDLIAKGTSKIKLNKMISKMAFLYEKIRNSLEYKDEHLLRKNAIERILKRRLNPKEKVIDISRLLINELIRAKYLEDNTVPEARIQETAQIISKYIVLFNELPKYQKGKDLLYLKNWCLSLMSCEIENVLTAPHDFNAYIEAFYHSVVNRITVKDENTITRQELEMQTYIAVVRAVTKSDDDILSYRLLKLYYPAWKNASPELILELAPIFSKIRTKINIQLNHPLGKYLSKNLKPYAVYFKVLQDVVVSHKDEMPDILKSSESLAEKVKEASLEMYKKISRKLRRNVIRSIIYIFLTKMVLAILLEFPFDLYFFEKVNYFTLGINVVFPPILLFLITMTVQVSAQKNTEKIIEGINDLVFIDNESSIFEIKRSYGRSKFLEELFNVIYALTFIVSYGGIIWLLRDLGFNILNGFLFILFLSIVSYFGIRVRVIAKEMLVVPSRENFLTFMLDIFSYPIIRVGKWISVKFSKINVFVFILDFIIEAPFKSLIEFIEDWFKYVKEKKEEIY